MNITKQTKIAVICGGISEEREISLRSGKNCFDALKRLNYENLKLVDLKTIDDLFKLKEENFEIAFLVTHGKYGEDGSIQGVLEWLKIPYTGSSVLASAISMDKWLTKLIAQSSGICTPKGFLINKKNIAEINLETLWKEFSKLDVLFLKPRCGGSSVNTYMVKSLSEFLKIVKALDLLSDEYIIEEYISGKEVTVSIIEINDKLTVLPILELKPKNDFYDYHAKYTKGMTEFIIPATLSDSLKNKIENNSLQIVSEVKCSSFMRVDFIVKDEIPYLLEINSLPGMTNTSDLPAQAACVGIKYDEVVEIILKSAKLYN